MHYLWRNCLDFRLQPIILFLIAFGIIAFLIPTKLPVFKKFDNKIKHYKEIIIKIEEEKYR